jgi:hypothetical protein
MKSVFTFAAVSALAAAMTFGGMVGTFEAAAAPRSLMPKKMQRTLKDSVVSKPKEKRTDCVDLSGTWVGQCVDSDGETYDEKLVIDQYACESIELDGTYLDIGGAKTETESDSGSYNAFTIYPQWSASRKALRARLTLSGRGFNVEYYSSGRGMVDFVPFEDKLISRTNFEFEFEYSGRTRVGTSWTECTYSKQ